MIRCQVTGFGATTVLNVISFKMLYKNVPVSEYLCYWIENAIGVSNEMFVENIFFGIPAYHLEPLI